MLANVEFVENVENVEKSNGVNFRNFFNFHSDQSENSEFYVVCCGGCGCGGHDLRRYKSRKVANQLTICQDHFRIYVLICQLESGLGLIGFVDEFEGV